MLKSCPGGGGGLAFFSQSTGGRVWENKATNRDRMSCLCVSRNKDIAWEVCEINSFMSLCNVHGKIETEPAQDLQQQQQQQR